MIKKFIKNAIVLSAFLVVTILISSSSMSITLSSLSEIKNLDSKELLEDQNSLVGELTGLDPNSCVNNPIFTTTSTDNHDIRVNSVGNAVPNMYGYIAYGGSSGEPEGPCYYPIDDPGDITSLAPYNGTFIAGGTWTCDEIWYGCQYNTGSLWAIYPYDGDMIQIGGGGTSCNGLAWDPVYNRLYATSGTALYEYDPETGEQEFIGSHGVSNTMIALAINLLGACYAWDVVSSGTSTLFTIDLETGEATEVGDMGQSLYYAQDGCFDWETNFLYLAAYSSSGFLATCDIYTGELTTIGDFEGGAEITASMIMGCCGCGDHDVGVYDIISPKDGEASEEMDVIVKVINYGINTEEDIPVDVVILKNGVDEEYNETDYIDVLHPGETINFEMPVWTPDDWHKVSNEYINYNITASTSLYGDHYPNNDKKEKRFELYFGYNHDIEITSIDSPCENGPGKTYPVEVTITNVGQYADCCIHIEISINEIDLDPEYLDNAFQDDNLEPGESRTFEFDDWTPDYLQYETSGSIDYIVQAEINMTGDQNPDNDVKSEYFTLDYWHDVTIRSIISPDYYSGWPFYWWLRYDDATTVNSFGCPDDCTFEYAIRLTTDELEDYKDRGYYINNVRRHHGWETPFQMDGKIKIYSEGTSTHPGNLITEEPFTCNAAGWHTIRLSEPVEITGDEDIWISCEVTHKAGQYPAGMDPSGPIDGKSDWLYINSEWVEAKDLGIYADWNLWAGILLWEGPPQPMGHIQPGTKDIDITVANWGTFPAENLTCYAEIYEHITEPINGNLVYEDNITDIDLIEPWGGEELLEFDDYTFAMEGVYSLLLNIPYDDDYPHNNDCHLRIDVDGTPPFSWIEKMYPPEPDGENGWYISSLEATICAKDPEIQPGISGSGIKGIYVRINDGSSQFFYGNCITIIIDEDGDNVPIEWWAVDRAGNEEAIHTFTIDMDQTNPTVDLVYEVTGGNPLIGWQLVFTVTATDIPSGMDRVEFYLNDVWQKTVSGPGPEYQWDFIYHGGLNIDVRADAYDIAGNMAADIIKNLKSNTYNQNSQQQTLNSKSSFLMQGLLNKLIVIQGRFK